MTQFGGAKEDDSDAATGAEVEAEAESLDEGWEDAAPNADAAAADEGPATQNLAPNADATPTAAPAPTEDIALDEDIAVEEDIVLDEDVARPEEAATRPPAPHEVPPLDGPDSGSYSVLPQFVDSMPPDEVTQLGNFAQLARIMDLDAVPRRARVEMVTVPLPTAAPKVLSRIDGKSSIRTIFVDCGLSEDEGMDVLLRLVECGMVAL
jgi:hypothetical protein